MIRCLFCCNCYVPFDGNPLMKNSFSARIHHLVLVCFAGLMMINVTVRADCSRVLIAEHSDGWKFQVGTAAVNWPSLDFVDNEWNSGTSPLGFGEPDVTTVTQQTGLVGDLPVTTYYRKEFQIPADAMADPSGFVLELKIRVDDGFVAYLNGTELQRWNLPSGPVSGDTPSLRALSAPEEQLYQVFVASSDSLRLGKNVLAIEVHQCNPQSTDLYLDARFSLIPGSLTRGPFTQGDALKQTLQFNCTHVIGQQDRVLDGFIDGGRGMQVDEFGYAVSPREILRVDRCRDTMLQIHLAYAASSELALLNEVDRATRIAAYIDRLMTPAEGRSTCLARSNLLAKRSSTLEVLIGDAVSLCGAGVCRHRALLFKLMADEAGLKCVLVRGNYQSSGRTEGHAWNELILADNRRVVVDVMNPQPDFYFPEVSEPSLRYYRTVANSSRYGEKPRQLQKASTP